MSAKIAFFPAKNRRSAAQVVRRAESSEGLAPGRLSRDQLDALVARGRRLQAEAMREGFRTLGGLLVDLVARSPRLLRGRPVGRRACC